MTNPYDLTPHLPAVVSFSGGRTSGFMLWQILQAHGGKLPDEVAVIFSNTGLEHPKTYEFVHGVEVQWKVPIIWVEYRVNEDGKHDYEIVEYGTHSTGGQPFDALIAKQRYLPNPVTRLCTVNLKMRTMNRVVRDVLGWNKKSWRRREPYTNCIGLRADEPHRVHRMAGGQGGEETYCPMYHAGHTEEDVLAFWSQQPFDLDLPGGSNAYGNCVGCFLKGADKLRQIAMHDPEYLEWWARAEERGIGDGRGKRFRNDRMTYRQMLKQAKAQGSLFGGPGGGDDTLPCICSD